MAVIVFYEKPGCANNTRQKQALIRSGHDVVALDIRVQAWTPDTLRPFFIGRPVADWFNRAAPRVKSGAVVPELMQADEALAAMCVDPLLIRRPLMESDGRRMVGFDEAAVNAWLGLVPEGPPLTEVCPRSDGACPPPKV
ncbi:arsenate reductase family protein [Paramagnetospirillum marisnigri]|uniref:Arsenate reductase family protein n=1 Tax=Paramagnetospirillum marisnigri TaxID=1285242 RepID=A0A178MM38_9PROT|nr:ArsC/Spx/MgsR family protein [Paramagnetospirillum marisnigri]OAN49148.1 arsenate reductase family protein [Paramagnetospirillum marisnigri]